MEFNIAYELNESATAQLQSASQQTSIRQYYTARKRYEEAISLLQQSIQKYHDLPELAYDCSTANLKKAMNNSRLAQENLKWAEFELNSLECLEAIDEIEKRTERSLAFYHQQQDLDSAHQSIQAATQLAQQTHAEKLCKKHYLEILIQLLQEAKSIADILNKENRYNQCLDWLKEANTTYAEALKHTNPELRTQALRQLLLQINSSIDSTNCAKHFRMGLKNLRTLTEKQLLENFQ